MEQRPKQSGEGIGRTKDSRRGMRRSRHPACVLRRLASYPRWRRPTRLGGCPGSGVDAARWRAGRFLEAVAHRMLRAADWNQGGAFRWSGLWHEAWDDCSRALDQRLGERPTEWTLPLRCGCWLFPTPPAQFRQEGATRINPCDCSPACPSRTGRRGSPRREESPRPPRAGSPCCPG